MLLCTYTLPQDLKLENKFGSESFENIVSVFFSNKRFSVNSLNGLKNQKDTSRKKLAIS